MVMEVVHEDMGEGSMQCTNHPYKSSTSGGICAACLQEKLGKLVSSSFPVAIFPSSSSSSSSRSDFAAGDQPRQLAPSSAKASEDGSSGECNYYSRRSSRLPFVLTQKKKSKKDGGVAVGGSDSGSIVFKRCKSTATPRRGMHFLDENFSDDYSPHRRGFWSFLYMSKHSSVKKSEKDSNFSTVGSSSVNGGGGGGSNSGGGGGGIRPRERKGEDFVVVDESGTPDQSAYDGKVSRSRSVGCGSRSFSGDFFERISTGFGDCTLRRVESQREGKPKVQSVDRMNGQDCIKERVRCGGIFGGFMITSSSSSSSSSSYWISSSAEENSKAIRHLSHGRSKSWGWALASPMRAFGSKPSSSVKRDNSSNKNVTPNLAAIPSLLAVSG